MDPPGDAGGLGGWSEGSALFVACRDGDAAMVEKLLAFQEQEHPGDDLKAAVDEHGRSLFYTCCMHGNTDAARLLVERGLFAARPNNLGVTPACAASWQGHLAAVRYLCEERSADIETADRYGVRPLYAACRSGHVDIARYLVERGADVAVQTDRGESILFTAADEGNVETLRYLAALPDVDTTVATDRGWTPLIAAACRGHDDAVAFLLDELGADPRACTEDGQTAFFGAAFHGQAKVAARLAAAAPDTVFLPIVDGQTPLFAAARRGHLDVARLIVQESTLIVPGASERAKVLEFPVEFFKGSVPCDGNRSAEAAEEAGHIELADYIERESSRMELLIYVVTGVVPYGVVQEMARSISPQVAGNETAFDFDSDCDWTAVSRMTGLDGCNTTVNPPVIAAAMRGKGPMQFQGKDRRLLWRRKVVSLAMGVSVDVEDGRPLSPLSPLRVLCEDLRQEVVAELWANPRYWLPHCLS